MAIPDYQKCMLPLLSFLADGQERSSEDALHAVSLHCKLTEAERAELLPSGMQVKIGNHVGWAKTYMVKAGLLADPAMTPVYT